MNRFSKFVAAAIQAYPIFLDRKATISKACDLIREAGRNGAQLIALPEVFVPGYPYWNWLGNPFEGSDWFRKLYKQSVEIPSEDVELLCAAARSAKANVVIGVNECSPISVGTIYNVNLVIAADGRLIGRHRKLVPTFAEKLTWGSGDGSSLRVYETEIGRLGTLACGENTNTLARFALLSQGEQVHVANYIAFPFTDNYDMSGAIQIRAGAHAFEGKVYTIVSCSAMSQEIVDALGTDDNKRRMLAGSPNAFSGIFGPDGKLVSEPLIDVEGIVYGEIDLERSIELKQYQDIVGHYNRFDIFDLRVNQRPLAAARFVGRASGECEMAIDERSDNGAGANQIEPEVGTTTASNPGERSTG